MLYLKFLTFAVNDPSWICHLRYWHLKLGELKLLSEKKMIQGLSFYRSLSEGCSLQPHAQKSFPKPRAKGLVTKQSCN